MKIGKIDIERPLLLAPMEGVTDIPFRLICKRLGADIVYSEFVNSEGLIRDSRKTMKKMLFLPEERPIGIQIYGGDESSMRKAAQMAEELEPDIIDINCGCWVRKVVGRGAGAGLLRDLNKMERIISSVASSVAIPVTVKTRLGWDEKSIQIVEVSKMVENSGAAGLTIHCRTRIQGQKGMPDYSLIPDVKNGVKIPIVINGGIDTPEKAGDIFSETGCDGVMIARGAIDNPWIFREIRYFLRTGKLLKKTGLTERIQLLTDHLRIAVQLKGEERAVIEFRKHYHGYLREIPGISKIRADLMKETDIESVMRRLEEFDNSHGENEPTNFSEGIGGN